MRSRLNVSFIVTHLGVFIALGVFFFQAFAVTRVGMSWDEPSSFFVGQANLMFWQSGNRQYVTDLKNKELFKHASIPYYVYGEDIYPPFPFLAAAISGHVISDTLHWMNIFDAYHLGEVFLGSLGVWAMYGLAVEAGLWVPAAAATAIAYALYPSIFGPMRNDAKDIPLVSMLAITSYFFLRWFRAWQTKKHGRVWWLGVLFAVTFGFTECTKPTAAIFVPIVIVWLIAAALRNRQFKNKLQPVGSFIGMSVILGLLAFIVFVIAWPWLWDDPVGKLIHVWTFFKTVGYNMPTPYFGHIYNAAVNLPHSYAYAILLIQTPVEITLLAAVGIGWTTWRFVKKAECLPFLFVVWFTISMGRFLLPGVIIYSWVRHFIDAMPAFFILAGFGVMYVAQKGVLIVKRLWTPFHSVGMVAIVIAGIIFVHEAFISWQFFPYELSYFNILVGGTANVAKHAWFDVGQGAGVREGMAFIAKDTSKPVQIYPCLMGHIMLFYLPPNVTLTRGPELGNYTMVPNSPSWFEAHFHLAVHIIKKHTSCGAPGQTCFMYSDTRNRWAGAAVGRR